MLAYFAMQSDQYYLRYIFSNFLYNFILDYRSKAYFINARFLLY